ncbi:glycoside hydrolase [Pyrenochaeta sp. MPI-SDFR-AT-0127]|nr:glycoside hydrolase [Pyrenochaeta sp. MPI-SDFR-AT-0127]
MMYNKVALALYSILPLVTAHGRITNITTSNGTVYGGWDPELALSSNPAPPLAAWTASNLGNIFVSPSHFNTSDISCHYNATPGALHVDTTSGDILKLQWNEWPVSHVGPVLTCLAACNGSCANVDKTKLEWVKIDELGWLNSTGWETNMLGGTWATDVLIANNYAWRVRIPEALAEGNYVLRHEILALHVANELDGLQAYPQCVNLRIAKRTSGEQKKPFDAGVLGPALYGMKDSGVLVDVHKNITGYAIPGPKLWSSATPLKQPNQKRWL